jgi:anthranilate phosphoribosyltransferase
LIEPADVLRTLAAGRSLDENQAADAVSSILTGSWSDVEIASFLSMLALRGETADELVGAAKSLLANAVSIDAPQGPLLDTCGTGGDGAGTFNVSTAVALVAAACGLKVAKHGNRSVSSRSGSADVLQHLGVNVEASPETAAKCLNECGIAFFFAPRWHPAVAKVQAVRRALKFRTIFNLVGPLANPLRAPLRMVGVGVADWRDALPARMAEALQRLGVESALVVAAEDGLDEITLAGSTRALRVAPTEIREEIWTPENFGLPRHLGDGWKVSTPSESAAVLHSVFANEPSPALDLVLANVAGALLTTGAATSLKDGVEIARRAIADGKASATLQSLVRCSHT